MRTLIHRFSMLFIFSFATTNADAFDGNCYQKIMLKERKDFSLCLESVTKDKTLRSSEKRLQKDLLERLVRVSDASVDHLSLCQNEMVQFFSQYGIKNLEKPISDMGPEILSFWQVFLAECPDLKSY